MTTPGELERRGWSERSWFLPVLFLFVVGGAVAATSAHEWAYWGQPHVTATVVRDHDLGFVGRDRVECVDMHDYDIVDEHGRTGDVQVCQRYLFAPDQVTVQWGRGGSTHASTDADPVRYAWIGGSIYVALVLLGIPAHVKIKRQAEARRARAARAAAADRQERRWLRW